MHARNNCLRRRANTIFAVLFIILVPSLSQEAPNSDSQLLAGLTADFDHLAPQTIRPAEGYILHPYLIPAGYYSQMWDWDGFFIGSHWANQSTEKAILLRDWVLSFAASADADGYVAGCITTKGPRPLFGKFAMKPFLAQGAVEAATALHDYEWIRPAWPSMQRILAYRKKTQFDEHWNLWFWDIAIQSGADNSAALTNDPKDRSAILAVDASVWAMREYEAMALIARKLGDSNAALRYKAEAGATREAILKNLWLKDEGLFLNRRRDNGAWVKAVTWSSFVPLAFGMLPEKDAQRMIREHLLNEAEMRSPYGFRSLSKSDPAYNNDAIIVPYSNWRGPIWLNANYLDWIALRRYGFSTEAHWLAQTLAGMLRRDIATWGSMHEDYNAETGAGLAPTPEQSHGGKFAGFVGWNLLAEDMLQCEVTGQHCMTLEIEQGN
ncbi:MAG: MGH1-like glycoside hydrolase domain-containing protein [Terracidiphilus sp.]